MTAPDADFIVIGAGSAGCVVASELARREAGSVLVLEAGPSEYHPLVNMPFGLVWLMGSGRDWRYKSTPQAGLNGRDIDIPRGRMVGGSGSINSMVWFRGCASDFNAWNLEGWRWDDVRPLFETLEARLNPTQLKGAHPVSQSLATIFGDGATTPTPERESAGVFSYNLSKGRRCSAAHGFLRPALKSAKITLRTGCEIDRIGFVGDAATQVHLTDATTLTAGKGIILSAGSIGSPAILLRSGIGPAADLRALGIDTRQYSQEVGQNLHDHPSVAFHFGGPNAGYGITFAQAPAWATAPLQYALFRKGRLASPTVEAGLFFHSTGASEVPDLQSHFLPFMRGWQGKRYVYGAGHVADITLCRPQSRGALRLISADPKASPSIDLGLFNDPSDLDTMTQGVARLRILLNQANRGRRMTELYPGAQIQSEEDLRSHIRSHCATAYHPVGTLRMGDKSAPVTPRLAVRGTRNLWVADASVMPSITSANTNAPSMMIGLNAGRMIAEDAA